MTEQERLRIATLLASDDALVIAIPYGQKCVVFSNMKIKHPIQLCQIATMIAAASQQAIQMMLDLAFPGRPDLQRQAIETIEKQARIVGLKAESVSSLRRINE